MNKHPQPRKSLREFVKDLNVWAKIGWTVLLGYIVGRIVYWLWKVSS